MSSRWPYSGPSRCGVLGLVAGPLHCMSEVVDSELNCLVELRFHVSRLVGFVRGALKKSGRTFRAPLSLRRRSANGSSTTTLRWTRCGLTTSACYFPISTASFWFRPLPVLGLQGHEGADSTVILEQSVRPLGPTSSLGSASSTGPPTAFTESFLLSPGDNPVSRMFPAVPSHRLFCPLFLDHRQSR